MLDRKAARAEDLVSNNALPIDAAETALGNSLMARQNLLAQKSGLARKKAQLAIAAVTKDRLAPKLNSWTRTSPLHICDQDQTVRLFIYLMISVDLHVKAM